MRYTNTMKELQLSVHINAPKEKVWNALWEDQSFREWAGIIDPGTYTVGELIEGNEIQFISAENGYGVTSLVEKLIPNEYLLLRHSADTQDTGTREREKQWAGGSEQYSLAEEQGGTTLSVVFDVPAELEELLKVSYHKAFEKVKELAE